MRCIRYLTFLFAALLLIAAAPRLTAEETPAPATRTHVRIETSLGNIDVELFDDKAPQTVQNFLKYVNEKFYDGTIIHRAAPGFVVQGGGFTEDLKEKPAGAPIKNESSVHGLRNIRGTIALARGSGSDSGQAQFFINLNDNIGLDRIEHAPQAAGYCVFGRVTEGMEVADAMTKVEKGNARLYSAANAEIAATDVPKTPILIKSIRVINPISAGSDKSGTKAK